MARREINSPREMFRRFMYVMYLGGISSAFILGLQGLGMMDPVRLGVAVFLIVSSWIIRRTGLRQWQFRRLAKSFPFGCNEDELPDYVCREMELLFERFTEDVRNITERQKIRRRVDELIEKDSRILHVFREKIAVINPTRIL